MILFKIILFALAIYYILKSVMRFILPPAFKNLEKRMREQQNQRYYQNKKEGEVTIQDNNKKKNDYGKGIGEYVDFEEIKD